MTIRILHTNDFHGGLSAARTERLGELRTEADYYFDCGDAIRAGNLAIPLREDPVWKRLEELRCTASVPGNRESHVLEAAFKLKMAGATHPVLCANLFDRKGNRPLLESIVLDHPAARVGIFGVMVPMVTAKMKTQAASAYLWTAPIPEAKRLAARLRPEVDLLIALTHIGLRQDQILAGEAPEIDLILGGHSHTVLHEPATVGRTSIVQAGSHGRFAGVMQWELGAGLTKYKLVSLP